MEERKDSGWEEIRKERRKIAKKRRRREEGREG